MNTGYLLPPMSIPVIRGTDTGFRTVLTDPLTGQPYDASGWSARCDVRTVPDRDEADLLATLTESEGITLEANGTITVAFTAAVTELITTTVAYFDVLLDPSGSARVPLVSGELVLTDPTTDWPGA